MKNRELFAVDEVETELRAYADRKHMAGQTELANGILKAVNHLQTITRAHAVELPPVKIGDEAYFIINGDIFRAKIHLIRFDIRDTGIKGEIFGSVTSTSSVFADFDDWGKTVFATKAEAEKVLYPCETCFCGTYRGCEGCSYGRRERK